MSRLQLKRTTVRLVESGEIMNTKIIAEAIAAKIRRGDIEV